MFLMRENVFKFNSQDPELLLVEDHDVKKFITAYGEEDFYGIVVQSLNTIREELLRQYRGRFAGPGISVLWTSILDPRFRSLKHLTLEKRETARTLSGKKHLRWRWRWKVIMGFFSRFRI